MSLRLLGEDSAGRYWVGRAGTTDVCLIMQLTDDEEVFASTCTEISSFYRSGLKLAAGGAGREEENYSATAYLLPADVYPPGLSTMAYSGSGLISGPSDALASVGEFEAERPNQETFHFIPLDLGGVQ